MKDKVVLLTLVVLLAVALWTPYLLVNREEEDTPPAPPSRSTILVLEDRKDAVEKAKNAAYTQMMRYLILQCYKHRAFTDPETGEAYTCIPPEHQGL